MVTSLSSTRANPQGAVHRTVEPSDLQFLTDEDVEEIGKPSAEPRLYALLTLNPAGGSLTRVEKKRLQAAVQAQCGTDSPSTLRLPLL